MITDWGQVLIGIAGTLVIQFLFCILILWGLARNAPVMESDEELYLKRYSEALEEQKRINLDLQEEIETLRNILEEQPDYKISGNKGDFDES
jgi:CRISPR/Cas system-associated exonuclease Cas4 (RecB family)